MKTEAPKGERSCLRPPGQQTVTGHSGLVPALLEGFFPSLWALSPSSCLHLCPTDTFGVHPWCLALPAHRVTHFPSAAVVLGLGQRKSCGPQLRVLENCPEGNWPILCPELGSPILEPGNSGHSSNTHSLSAPEAGVAPGSSSSHMHTAPCRRCLHPTGASMGLCPHYQTLEGHMGLPDLGLSQKRELSPALKDSP